MAVKHQNVAEGFHPKKSVWAENSFCTVNEAKSVQEEKFGLKSMLVHSATSATIAHFVILGYEYKNAVSS